MEARGAGMLCAHARWQSRSQRKYQPGREKDEKLGTNCMKDKENIVYAGAVSQPG